MTAFRNSPKWLTTQIATDNDAMPLTAAQVAAWQQQGAVAIDGLVPLDLVMQSGFPIAVEETWTDAEGHTNE